MTVLVITTGGTIGAIAYDDPRYPPKFSTMPPKGKDLVKDVLLTLFSRFQTHCVSLEPRDSKQIDEAYRRNILRVISSSPENRVLITHGTDTLLTTADFLYKHTINVSKFHKKRIILTGAMTPLANGKDSDGYLNLEFSLAWLTSQTHDLSKINIVLCGFQKHGEWKPRLYPYKPNRWEKVYDPDGRYNRLRELP
jgi:L-asparaginase